MNYYHTNVLKHNPSEKPEHCSNLKPQPNFWDHSVCFPDDLVEGCQPMGAFLGTASHILNFLSLFVCFYPFYLTSLV